VGKFLQKHPATTTQAKADVALSFEQAAVDVLVQKTIRAAKKYKAQSITLSGGVAANKRLRETLAVATSEAGVHFSVPEFELCTDNAKMIAIAAYFSLRHGKKAMPPSKVKADSNWEAKPSRAVGVLRHSVFLCLSYLLLNHVASVVL
jgi:tRNA A37 threonylcarbamoyltransferase TsaD